MGVLGDFSPSRPQARHGADVGRGNPLCFSNTPGGLYFTSLPAGLPGKVFSITDEYAGVLRLEGGSVKRRDLSILA